MILSVSPDVIPINVMHNIATATDLNYETKVKSLRSLNLPFSVTELLNEDEIVFLFTIK